MNIWQYNNALDSNFEFNLKDYGYTFAVGMVSRTFDAGDTANYNDPDYGKLVVKGHVYNSTGDFSYDVKLRTCTNEDFENTSTGTGSGNTKLASFGQDQNDLDLEGVIPNLLCLQEDDGLTVRGRLGSYEGEGLSI